MRFTWLSLLLFLSLFALACDEEGGSETLAGETAGTEAGETAGTEAGETAGTEAGETAGTEAGETAGTEAGEIAGTEAGETAGTEAGETAGTEAGETAGAEVSNTHYEFESRFTDGSSISYSGQTARHALITSLKSYMSGLEDSITANGVFTEGELVAVLEVFFDCADGVCAGEAIDVSSVLPTEQMTISDISSSKNLVGKIAGNDPVGQHKDWAVDFEGWDDAGDTPESLVRRWFNEVEVRAIAISNADFETDPNGDPISRPDLSATGLDYTQLIQKFLLGAVAFSQGADDYLDDSDEGKGLLASNNVAVDGKPYSALEHSWDEAFGYFGAARDYLDYSDDEIASKGGRDDYQGSHDLDGDGQIDLVSEFNWGHSLNAAKRDRGHSTDFTSEAFQAFVQGRQLIASVEGELSADQFVELQEYRDTAVMAWEGAIAATVIHYINDVLADMDSGEDYSFSSHAKHWSELKGFALSLQFNPRSPLSDLQFIEFHTLIGIAPALPGDANFESYKTSLLDARALLGDAYGFTATDVGTW